MGEAWIILRTASRLTLPLAASLAEDGFKVWTPVETKICRVPRANARFEVRLAIMPSYVFAGIGHLVDLLELADMPVKPRRGAGRLKPAHPGFSVLHAFGRIPTVADHHLAELRKIEARRTPAKRAPYSFPMNKAVRVTGGLCGGMTGVVIRSTPLKTVIQITGGYPIEISTSLLQPDSLEGLRPAALMAA